MSKRRFRILALSQPLLLPVFAACGLVLAGCTAMTGSWTQSATPPNLETSSANPKKEPPQATEASKPNVSVPRPRTLPRALQGYWHCLHMPLDDRPSSGNASKDASAKQEQGQNTSKTGSEKKEDEASQENQGRKNPKEKEEAGEKDKEKSEKKDEEKDKADKKEEEQQSWYSAHAQATMVTQVHDHFHSPYIGPNSLLPVEHSATSVTGTLFLDARLWECGGNTGELVFNPELSGGRGFSNASGIAGFPNGEITRVGIIDPTPYIARLFLRQTCGLDGEQEKVEDGPNQIAGRRDVDRITLTVGKFSATDLVDDNRYSHDPRTQFLPWSIMYNGAWDYPANVRGYTYGVGIDYNRKNWALRYGVWAEPKIANGAPLDPHILQANGHVVEWEGRYTVCEHPGKVRLLAYLNRAHMGDYQEALAQMPVNPDVTLTRAYRIKYGFGLSWDQELTKDLGVFGRLGWNDGHTESWAFTAIDRVAELGFVLNGRCWCRPRDQVGLAVDVNGISLDHRDYLAAGGLDFIIGDGRLRYGPEEIFDIFYDFELSKGILVTADFQEVNHPAYNRDRGPVSIGSLRVHLEF